MNSNNISRLLRTKSNQYVIKDYSSKNATSSCWSNFGLPAEITNETTKEYKIIDGFATCKLCLVTYAFRPGLKDIGARYGRLGGKLDADKILSCPNTIKRRIQNLANITRQEISPRLSAAAAARGKLTFSPDLWTDRYKKQAYLGKNRFYLITYFLLDQIVHCTTHRLHNVLRHTFTVPKVSATNLNQNTKKRKRKEDSDDEIYETTAGPLGDVARVINGCKKVVPYVKKIGLNRKIQEKGGLCLIQENQTRWLSLHGMLNSIERSYDILIVLVSEISKLDLITSINRRILRDIIWFLEPFRRMITDLQAKDRPTLPMVVPCIWFLKDRCSTILEEKIELRDIHFAATMLNPNYRTLRQATKTEQAQRYLRKRLTLITAPTASSTQLGSSSSDEDSRDYLSRYVDNPRVSRKQDELTRYLKLDHHETNANDILGFWKTMINSLPNLAKVASQILIIPGTSASVERSFSAAGQIISERRSNISPDVVNDILLLPSTKRMKMKEKD